jgi:hypothetical protein
MNGRSCIENAGISVGGEPRHVDRTGILGTHCHQSGLIRLFDSHQERGGVRLRGGDARDVGDSRDMAGTRLWLALGVASLIWSKVSRLRSRERSGLPVKAGRGRY